MDITDKVSYVPRNKISQLNSIAFNQLMLQKQYLLMQLLLQLQLGVASKRCRSIFIFALKYIYLASYAIDYLLKTRRIRLSNVSRLLKSARSGEEK